MEPDFTGYATMANRKCSDGRTITPDAFKHQDQETVPLVWQHAHNEPANVLGHAILEHREDGTYCQGFFNDTPAGVNSKKLVQHGDIKSLSIYANQLVEKAKNVIHGQIREVSLVLAGANPGARIDFVRLAHGDGSYDILEDEAIIFSGPDSIQLEHADSDNEEEKEEEAVTVQHAEEGKTVKDVFDSFTSEQKDVVYYMIGEALKGEKAAKHSDAPDVSEVFHTMSDDQKDVAFFMIGQALEQGKDIAAAHADGNNESGDTDSDEATAAHADKEGSQMSNVFDQTGTNTGTTASVLSHSDKAAILAAAKKGQGAQSLKDVIEGYVQDSDTLQHGIQDIGTLFPDAKAITTSPDWLKRRTEWVAEVMTGTRHTPFSRIKSMLANLTLEEARAKGYIKGNLKKEEFFRVSKRVTTPQTIYKKQQLDRDDILDITDFDVVVWLKAEMRIMLEEEIARAILIGDGRSTGDPDKIKEENVRPIATDNDLYVTQLYLNLDNANSSYEEIVDSLTESRRHYRGSGNPTLFCGELVLSKMLLIKDSLGRRIYPNLSDLTSALRVSKIVTVEIMDEPSSPILAIVVNLNDYVVGADKGGDISLFDDFDIDFNQYKYLIETRISGALVKAKSALVLRKVAANDTLVDPVAPSYNSTNKTVTVPTTTGIVYKNKLTNTTLTTGSPVTLSAGDELRVIAVPASGYYLSSTAGDEFLYTYERGRVDPGLS